MKIKLLFNALKSYFKEEILSKVADHIRQEKFRQLRKKSTDEPGITACSKPKKITVYSLWLDEVFENKNIPENEKQILIDILNKLNDPKQVNVHNIIIKDFYAISSKYKYNPSKETLSFLKSRNIEDSEEKISVWTQTH